MSAIIRPVLTYAADPTADKYYLPPEPARLLKADPQRRAPVSVRSGTLKLARFDRTRSDLLPA